MQAVAALAPHVPLLLAATALSLAVEGVLYRWQRGVPALFAKAHADVTVRHVLRDLLLVGFWRGGPDPAPRARAGSPMFGLRPPDG
ncbi:hypothetical protein SFUMM280S_02713 [Streptomyces fumanus]